MCTPSTEQTPPREAAPSLLGRTPKRDVRARPCPARGRHGSPARARRVMPGPAGSGLARRTKPERSHPARGRVLHGLGHVRALKSRPSPAGRGGDFDRGPAIVSRARAARSAELRALCAINWITRSSGGKDRSIHNFCAYKVVNIVRLALDFLKIRQNVEGEELVRKEALCGFITEHDSMAGLNMEKWVSTWCQILRTTEKYANTPPPAAVAIPLSIKGWTQVAKMKTVGDLRVALGMSEKVTPSWAKVSKDFFRGRLNS